MIIFHSLKYQNLHLEGLHSMKVTNQLQPAFKKYISCVGAVIILTNNERIYFLTVCNMFFRGLKHCKAW